MTNFILNCMHCIEQKLEQERYKNEINTIDNCTIATVTVPWKVSFGKIGITFITLGVAWILIATLAMGKLTTTSLLGCPLEVFVTE